MKTTNRIAGATLLYTVWVSAAYGGEIFFDEAEVLDAQPVYETRHVPEQIEQCGYEESWSAAAVDPAALGDARASGGEDDIVAALRSEPALRGSQQRNYRCRNVTRTAEREELAGYRVRFRYDGRVYERQMAEQPDGRIRVRVRVSAGESRLLTRSDRQPRFAVRQASW